MTIISGLLNLYMWRIPSTEITRRDGEEAYLQSEFPAGYETKWAGRFSLNIDFSLQEGIADHTWWLCSPCRWHEAGTYPDTLHTRWAEEEPVHEEKEDQSQKLMTNSKTSIWKMYKPNTCSQYKCARLQLTIHLAN